MSMTSRVIALEDEITSLKMVINHLEAENAHCSEELAIIRLAMRELETPILPAIAPDGEDQTKKVQSTKKTSSSRGDSPNSRNNKLHKQASDSSSEGDTSEEGDVHTHVGLRPDVLGSQSKTLADRVQITPVIPGLPPRGLDPEGRWRCS
jgi:hypothetical protein